MSEPTEIVVIDDSSAERALVCLVLRQEFEGSSVVEISKPLELAEYLGRGACAAAVVARDLAWGEGYRVLYTLRGRFPDCRLFVIGTQPLQRFGAQEIELDIDGYLTRDAGGLLELGPAIRASLRKHGRLSSRVNAVTPSPAGLQTFDGAASAAPVRDEPDLEPLAVAVAQDMREPLRQIAGELAGLSATDPRKLNGDTQRVLAQLRQNVDRMQAVVDGVLQYAAVASQSDPKEFVELSEILDEALAHLREPVASAQADIRRAPLPKLPVDRQQMVRLFESLLGNAIEFRGSRKPEIHVGATDLGDAWRLEITDNGIGIDQQDTDRVFRLFQRLHAHEKYPGAGIGLAVCRRIVRRHGGEIWVSSIPDVGSTFYFTLPKSTATAGRNRD